MPHRVAIIGTGIMGRRMLGALDRHPDFEPVWAWDPNPAARAAAEREHPGLEFAEDVLARPADLVYIATPPAAHVSLARQVTSAVLCEKPLAVDVAAARTLVEDIRIPNAVNFPFATQPEVAGLERTLAEGRHGDPLRLEIRLFFNDWPRAWQRGAASWLARPEQGGFLREVFSHFAYLTDRLLGPIELVEGTVERGPVGTETAVRARLHAGGTPVVLVGDVGGRAPDYNEWTLYGSRASFRLQDWNRLSVGDDDGWRDHPLAPAASPGLAEQLDGLAAMLGGRPHPLPTFADALRVQELVEHLLACQPPGPSAPGWKPRISGDQAVFRAPDGTLS